MWDGASLLQVEGVRLGLSAVDRQDAIIQVGRVLEEIGATGQEYTADMLDREASASTYIGHGVAIPHGTYRSRQRIERPAIVVLQFPDGVGWGGEQAKLCIGLAATGDQQIGLLGTLGRILVDIDNVDTLHRATDVKSVVRALDRVALRPG
jgi:mannitol/fructose-specific phosphotransferase system IIA component